jgi:hypothetical protein
MNNVCSAKFQLRVWVSFLQSFYSHHVDAIIDLRVASHWSLVIGHLYDLLQTLLHVKGLLNELLVWYTTLHVVHVTTSTTSSISIKRVIPAPAAKIKRLKSIKARQTRRLVVSD